MVWQTLKTSEKQEKSRFSQPFQVLRTSVEPLTKRPVIQPNDKDSLQQYAKYGSSYLRYLRVNGILK